MVKQRDLRKDSLAPGAHALSDTEGLRGERYHNWFMICHWPIALPMFFPGKLG